MPIPLGVKDNEGNYYVYNHLHFSVQTIDIDDGFNIVGFSVQPMSINHTEMERQENLLASKIANAASIQDIAAFLQNSRNTYDNLTKFSQTEKQRLTEGQMFKFSYSAEVKQAAQGLTWQNRLEPYGRRLPQ